MLAKWQSRDLRARIPAEREAKGIPGLARCWRAQERGVRYHVQLGLRPQSNFENRRTA